MASTASSKSLTHLAADMADQNDSLLWPCRMSDSRVFRQCFTRRYPALSRISPLSSTCGRAICGLAFLLKQRDAAQINGRFALDLCVVFGRSGRCSQHRSGHAGVARMGCRHPQLAHAVAAQPAGRAAVFSYQSCLRVSPAKSRAPSRYSAFLPPPNRQTQRRMTSHRL